MNVHYDNAELRTFLLGLFHSGAFFDNSYYQKNNNIYGENNGKA